MRVLILGENGFISKEYQRYFEKKSIEYTCFSLRKYCASIHPSSIWTAVGHTHGFNTVHFDFLEDLLTCRPDVDIFSHIRIFIDNLTQEIKRVSASYNCDYILNCIGYTGSPNIDEIATSNIALIKNIALNQCLPYALGANIKDKKIAHISTGCIHYSYTKKTKGWTEEDTPTTPTNKMSYYSACKYLGEKAILENKNVKAFRLRIPFSSNPHPKNYLTKILNYTNLLSMRNSLSSVDSFIQSTTYLMEHDAPSGAYNATNDGAVTARDICRLMKSLFVVPKNHKFHFYDDYETFMSNEKVLEPRSNCVLNSKKISDMVPEDFMPHVKYELERCIKDYATALSMNNLPLNGCDNTKNISTDGPFEYIWRRVQEKYKFAPSSFIEE